MTSTVRAQEASSSAPPRFTYHVFLSFRGEDTRKTFTDHLYTALNRAGFHTFRDDDGIKRGEHIVSELQRAIQESRISIIVFSKDYASSRWCLDELVSILTQKRTSEHQILPVFYDVAPSDVRKQTRSFKESFLRHERRFKTEAIEKKSQWMDKIEEWRAALREITDIAGIDLKSQDGGYESKCIERIVTVVEEKLKPRILVADSIDLTNTYINAAFRLSRRNEVYLFMKKEYVKLDYAPGTANDKVLYGPVPICKGFPSLLATPFAEDGIDCAFSASEDGDKAFIFSGNLCAYIDYAPSTPNDKIINGPMTITTMFPFFKGTPFESGIDAAFESTFEYEAYLFKGDQYALINYGPYSRCLFTSSIAEGFPSLRNTIFESGMDAAFDSHRYNEAYLFKGDSYARINFAPGTSDDYIINNRIEKILPKWPSLRSIWPRRKLRH